MKIFGPPPSASSIIDASNQYPSKASSQSDSTGDERNLLASLAAEANEKGSTIFGEDDTLAPNHQQLEAFPCSYKPSPYDSRVPTPRNCGARFNRSGYLVAFGLVDRIYIRKNEDFCGGVSHQLTIDDRREERSIPRIVPIPATMRGFQIKSGGIKSDGIRPQQPESQSPYPRSLAEYCIFVNPTPPSSLRQSSSTWNGSFQYSPPIRSISSIIPPPIAHWPKPPSISESLSQLCSASSGEYQKKVAGVDSLKQSQQQQQKTQLTQSSQPRPIMSGSRIFGTSPNSTIAEPSGHSFSLQNVIHSIRHRGNSMSSALPQTNTGNTTSSIEHLTTTFHKQPIVDENLFSGLAAVMPEQVFNSTVLIYDASTLLPISQPLAKSYRLLGDNPSEICRHNFEQVLKYGCGRSDLLALWQFLEQLISFSKSFSPIQNGDIKKPVHLQFGRLYKIESAKILRAARSIELTEIPWNSHPLGRELINRLLEHYVSKFDLQTAAVIICLFNITKNNGSLRSKIRRRSTTWTDTTRIGVIRQSKTTENNNINIRPQTKTISTSSSSAAISSMPTSTTSEHNVTAIIPQQLTRKTSATSNAVFSTSIYAPLDPFCTIRGRQYVEAITAAKAATATTIDRLSPSPEYLSSSPKPKTTYTLPPRKERNINTLSLDQTLSTRFNEVKRTYADILYRWRMYKKCAEVLKHCDCDNNDESIGIIKALIWCHFCGQQKRGDSLCCIKGRKTSSIMCSICERPCKGIATTCVSCSHGGHLAHLATWFDTQSQCPLGCGCECKF
ncbi:hypothetical protein ACQ4LE_007995 [Meloidogyne hapla]